MKVCEYCGKEIIGRDLLRSKYCSEVCNVLNYQKIRKEQGREISKKQSSPDFNGEIDYFKSITVEIPFSRHLSKNIMGGLGKWTHRPFLKRESKKVREDIGWLIKKEMFENKVSFVQDKIWLSIFVQKPDMTALDPINVIDLVCDGIKTVIGVDDRWFCIKILDWSIAKTDPKIIIEIGQADDIPKQVCSYCGRILPQTDFNLNKRNPTGRSRVCRECLNMGRK